MTKFTTSSSSTFKSATSFESNGRRSFVYGADNPIRFIDPDGMAYMGYGGSDEADEAVADGSAVRTAGADVSSDRNQKVNFLRTENKKTGEINDIIVGNADDDAKEGYISFDDGGDGAKALVLRGVPAGTSKQDGAGLRPAIRSMQYRASLRLLFYVSDKYQKRQISTEEPFIHNIIWRKLYGF